MGTSRLRRLALATWAARVAARTVAAAAPERSAGDRLALHEELGVLHGAALLRELRRERLAAQAAAVVRGDDGGRSVAPQEQRAAHHGDAAHGHGATGDEGRQGLPGEQEEEAGGQGDAQTVVAQGEEEVQLDASRLFKIFSYLLISFEYF